MMQPDIATGCATGKRTIFTRPEAIATGNIGCMMQLQDAVDAPVVHTVELLDWATGGPAPAGLDGGWEIYALGGNGRDHDFLAPAQANQNDARLPGLFDQLRRPGLSGMLPRSSRPSGKCGCCPGTLLQMPMFTVACRH